MAEKKVTRKLAAILAIDMVGYSRLMEKDEEGTIARQKAHRAELIDPKFTEHGGRIVKSLGDGLLVEFASAVDAARCAVEVQREMAEREAEVPQDRRIAYRVGINIGDIVVEDDDIYGDGVNIAARLEALAEPGGICVSRTVLTHVRNKVELGFVDLGPQKVKNIEEPVPTYRVLLDPTEAGTVVAAKRTASRRLRWAASATAVVLLLLGAGVLWWQPWVTRVEAASLKRMAFPLPKKPSIAVLPFDNLSGDAKQDYLGDSVARNIIGSLSKISQILVIARKSTTAYKGQAVHSAAEALGVRYVLKGSIQNFGDRLRVTAQLIDAVKGRYIWSERYDRPMADLLTVLDDITREIVVALHVKFTEGERARVRHRHTNNLKAWEFAATGYAHFEKFTKNDTLRARELFSRAVKLDPNYTWAWAKIGFTHTQDAAMGFTKDRAASIKQAEKIAEIALALDDRIADVHMLRALIRRRQGKYDEALGAIRKAVSLDPNYPQARALLAVVEHDLGEWDKAIASSKLAVRLHPHHPSWYLPILGRAYIFKGQVDLAISTFEKGLRRAESDGLRAAFHRLLAIAHVEAANMDKARRHVTDAQRLVPSSLETFRKFYTFKNPAHLERMLTALRKAGLPEGTPPLPKKPSIVVLPFTNMSGDKDQEYFAQGMRDDLITGLSKLSGLIVGSRTSANAAARTNKTIKEIARMLGVRYVIEGSVRRAGGKVRINAQLIDATTGGHVWAETFNRPYKQIFILQDEVKGKIIQALKVELTPKERTALKRRPTKSLEAYDLYLKAEKLRLTHHWKGYRAAFALYDKALKLDPNFVDAYTGNAEASLRAWRFTWATAIYPPMAKQRVLRSVAKALALDPDNVRALAVQTSMQLHLQKHDLALALARGAVARHPENAMLRLWLGRVLLASGRPKEAREALMRAEALAPKPSPELLIELAFDYAILGEAEHVVRLMVRARKGGANVFPTAVRLTNAYARLGNIKKAKAELETIRKFVPGINVALLRVSFAHYRSSRLLRNLFDAYHKAGMPEWPYGFKGRPERRLRKAELETLYRRKRVREIGTNPWGNRYEYLHDGRGNWTGRLSGSAVHSQIAGTIVIDGDRYCIRTDAVSMGRKSCGEVFRNRKGSPRTNDEYVRINQWGLWKFSVKPLEKQ